MYPLWSWLKNSKSLRFYGCLKNLSSQWFNLSEFGPFLSLSIDILRAMRNIIQHCKCWLGEGKKREKNSYKTCLGIFIDVFWWCTVVLMYHTVLDNENQIFGWLFFLIKNPTPGWYWAQKHWRICCVQCTRSVKFV